MDVTGRWWVTAGTGLALVALATLAERPLLLVAAAAIGAWLITVAGYSARAFSHVRRGLTVSSTVAKRVTVVDSVEAATLAVSRPEANTTVPLSVHAPLPPGLKAVDGDPVVGLDRGEATAETAFSIAVPISGRFEFPSPTVRMTDPFGLYRVQVPVGTSPTISARPTTPKLHVGQGGNRRTNVYGRHETDHPGSGVTTHELRQYVAGDDIKTVDWKATARLGEVYVRETVGETDRRLLLLVDHRGRMGTGPVRETMIDYAREVGLGIAERSAEVDDPLGIWTIGDGGITTTIHPNTTSSTYSRIEETLYDLKPTDGTASVVNRAPITAQRTAARLGDTEDAFTRTLRTYVADPASYVKRIRDDPLVETVREARTRFGTDVSITIITSDDDMVSLREAVKLATRGGAHANVFVTPRCLFEGASLTDLDDVYDRYRTFEELRRQLSGPPRVAAFEIAPGDRLNAVLAHRRAIREAPS